MKKIVGVIDALNFTPSQLDGFDYITREAKGKLTLVFMENILATQVPLTGLHPDGVYTDMRTSAELAADVAKRKEENLVKLIHACRERDMEPEMHEAAGIPIQEIIAESRFADLLLISHNTSFATLFDSNPTRFVKDALAEAECPVIVTPEKLNPAREVIFAYNGTSSSMYAIRQFTQLFPGMRDIPVQVIYVVEGGAKALPHEKLLKNYLEIHYDEVKYTVLNGEPRAEFLAQLMHRRDCLVTYGAYGRSRLSRFFHRSEAENVLRTVNIPVFITHP